MGNLIGGYGWEKLRDEVEDDNFRLGSWFTRRRYWQDN